MTPRTTSLLALSLSFAFPACAALPNDFVQWSGNDKKPRAELNYPGFFDVGVGFGFATREPFDDTGAGGVMLSLRAYPAGRWYSTLQSNGAKAAKVLEETLAESIANTASLTSTNLVANEAAEYYRAVLSRKEEGAIAKFNAAKLDENFLESNALKGSVAKAIHGSKVQQLDQLFTAIEKLEARSNPNPPLKDDPIPLTRSITAEALSSDDEVVAAAKEVEAAAAASDPIKSADSKSLAAILSNLSKAESSLSEKEWYVVSERDTWRHRLAVFYGRTIDDLGGRFDAPADVLGVSYDVAPQFAIVAGWAFVDTGDDTSSSLYLGTSLNLNAFKQFFGDLFSS